MPVTTIVDDPAGRYPTQTALLASNVAAAFDMWSPYLAASVGQLEIRLHLVTGYASGAAASSTTAVAIGNASSLTICDQGAAFELRTGIDPNGAAPDIDVFLDADHLGRRYWINTLDGAIAPRNRVDLVAVLAHELGHALAFNGYHNAATGALDGDYASVFDRYVTLLDGAPYFNGPAAMAHYGGPIPLTGGNLFHLGAQGGSDTLLRDLMNGTEFVTGLPYSVSALDVAILSDCGVPTILSDTLSGSTGGDTIGGGAGNDRIFGGASDDNLSGGVGQDYVRGDDGNDIISGGDDFDDINGMLGDDTAHGDAGDDWVVGGKDRDLLYGDAGADVVFGNLGDDTCYGGDGADTVRGGQGDDVIDGGAGDDYVSGDRGDDTVAGGPGADLFHTFGEAGLDRVVDFHAFEGDRVQLDPGTAYSAAQVGADTIVSLGQAGRLILVGVDLSGLPEGWIFGA